MRSWFARMPRHCTGYVWMVVAVGATTFVWLGASVQARRAVTQEPVRVERVIDGDTCQLADGRRVRLAGIDAPELAHGGRPAQYYALEAMETLKRLTQGLSVQLVPVGEGRDRFGRTLGDLRLPDGKRVSERMLAAGAAFVFWFSDLPRTEVERLLAVQRRAMAVGAGFWPRILALEAPRRPYVGNTASHRFHAPDCSDARKIRRSNRVLLPTQAQAFLLGYAPARDCSPWPLARNGSGGSGRIWN